MTEQGATSFKIPEHLKKFSSFLPVLNEESPRGAAMLASAYLDEQLGDMIRAFLLEGDSADRLIEGFNAPLGSFSTRIAAASALGLITEAECCDCTLIRKVRNKFAHEVDASFADQSVAGWCAALTFRAGGANDPNPNINPDARGAFVTAAVALILRFTNRPARIMPYKVQRRDWPY